MKNLLLTLLLFMSGLTYSQTVITDTLNCQGDIDTLVYVVPNTGSSALFLNCDTTSTTFYSPVATHLFSVSLPSNPNDSIQTEWTIDFGLDTNLIVEPFFFTFSPYVFTQEGCYRFNVVFTCVTGGTITLTSTWYVSTVGIEELSINKTVTKITDMMGKECLPEPNKLLIYHYSDDTRVKILKQQEQ
jgi:hypothetical protein